MSDPNMPKTNMDILKEAIDSQRPKPETFAGSIYTLEEVRSDESLLDDYGKSPNYGKSEEKHSDASVLEATFTKLVFEDDWFGEFEIYDDDPDFTALTITPTSKIDDTFNHVDIIGIIGNEMTEHEKIPFTIDLTYNGDSDKLKKKFNWIHRYGKKEDSPDDVSEFGERQVKKDALGNDVITAKPIPTKDRKGLKIPGFASVKYYEDTDNIWNPIYPKGRIPVAPRFIVGYSPEISDTLARGLPDKEKYIRQYGESAYNSQKNEYDSARKTAKWCTLLECSKQASDIKQMLENLEPDDIQQMDSDELTTAKKQIAAMEAYFNHALEIARKQTTDDPTQLAAMNTANRDTMCQSILIQSGDTFIAHDWK